MKYDEMIMRGWTDEMKDCPFCDSKKLVVVRVCTGSGWHHCVRCENCGAEGPNIREEKYGTEGAERAAIEDWNTR